MKKQLAKELLWYLKKEIDHEYHQNLQIVEQEKEVLIYKYNEREKEIEEILKRKNEQLERAEEMLKNWWIWLLSPSQLSWEKLLHYLDLNKHWFERTFRMKIGDVDFEKWAAQWLINSRKPIN